MEVGIPGKLKNFVRVLIFLDLMFLRGIDSGKHVHMFTSRAPDQLQSSVPLHTAG